MPITTGVADTPNYVLLAGNVRMAPRVLPLPAGDACKAIYGFSDKGPYDEFCAQSHQALTPYPLVKRYLQSQIEAPESQFNLVVLDAEGPEAPCLYAATMEAVLEAMTSGSKEVPTVCQLRFDPQAAAYRVELDAGAEASGADAFP